MQMLWEQEEPRRRRRNMLQQHLLEPNWIVLAAAAATPPTYPIGGMGQDIFGTADGSLKFIGGAWLDVLMKYLTG